MRPEDGTLTGLRRAYQERRGDYTGNESSAADGAQASSPFPSNYEIVCVMVETRLSRTWKAFDLDRGAHVVIKEPLERLLLRPDAIERFRGEVQSASRLSHANIVPILSTHLSEPPYFYTMPLIEGDHLDEYCRSHTLSTFDKLTLFLKLCKAVSHAHQCGVIHRDLKPNNIIVDERGEPQLLDFGLARIFEADDVRGSYRVDSVMGAPGYMAPEQAEGLSGDTRTDVYSLGVILFRLLTDALPISAAKHMDETLRRILRDPPIPPVTLRPDTGVELNAIVLKALAKSPVDRYSTVQLFADDVSNLLSNRPVQAWRSSAGYVVGKWIRRHLWGTLAATAIGFALLVFVSVALHLRFSAVQQAVLAREAERHPMAVFKGRMLAVQGNPLGASDILWDEQLQYDNTRTRYALWELFRRYPCVYQVGNFGWQLAVEFSPDGNWLASIGDDERLIIYEATTGKVSQVAPAEQVHARSLRFTPTRHQLLVGGTDGIVRTFDFASDSGRLTGLRSTLRHSQTPITALATDASGDWLAIGDYGGLVRVWSRNAIGDYELRYHWSDHGVVCDFAFDAQGVNLACAHYAPDVVGDPRGGGRWIRRLATGIPLESSTVSCRTVLFSMTDQHLYTGYNQLEALCVPGMEHTWHVAPSIWGIRSVSAPGNLAERFLAVGFGDGTIRVLDLSREEWLPVQGFHINEVADRLQLAFSPDGERLASVGRDGLRTWDLQPIQSITVLDSSLHDAAIEFISLSAEGVPLACILRGSTEEPNPGFVNEPAAADQIVCPATSSDSPERRTPLVVNQPLGKVISCSSKRLLASTRWSPASATSSVFVLEHSYVDQLLAKAEIPGRPSSRSLHWIDAPDGWILAGYHDGRLWAWRPFADDPVSTRLELVHDFGVNCTFVTSTPDHNWVAACSAGDHGNGTVALWRRREQPAPGGKFLDRYELISEFPAYGTLWSVLLVQHASTRLVAATAGGEREVYLWDALTGSELGKLSGHKDAINEIQLLNENLLVTASRDRTVRIWDLASSDDICLLHTSTSPWATIDVNNGRIAIADGLEISVADTRDIQKLIDGNTGYHRLRSQR